MTAGLELSRYYIMQKEVVQTTELFVTTTVQEHLHL